jgi:hypothetical protein
MLRSPTIFCVLMVSCASHGAAQDRMQAAQAAVKSMAEETLECAVYFDIVSAALLNSNAGNTAQEYIKARKLAVGRAESLSEGIVNARYNALVRDMAKQVIIANAPRRVDEKLSDVSIEEITVLRDRYAKLCKKVLEDPGSRAKYWMEHQGKP